MRSECVPMRARWSERNNCSVQWYLIYCIAVTFGLWSGSKKKVVYCQVLERRDGGIISI